MIPTLDGTALIRGVICMPLLRGACSPGTGGAWLTTTSTSFGNVPDGAVILDEARTPCLVLGDQLLRFTFGGWIVAAPRPRAGTATILTPPTSVAALQNGYVPTLHPSAS